MWDNNAPLIKLSLSGHQTTENANGAQNRATEKKIGSMWIPIPLDFQTPETNI